MSEFERGPLNKDQLQAKYGIGGNTRIFEWCKKYGKLHYPEKGKIKISAPMKDWSCYLWLDIELRERLNFKNMSKIRKQYDREFKVMAVELGKGRSDLGMLAKELEIRPALLYRWRRELETKAGTSFPEQGKVIYTPEQAEINRLKKELPDM